MHAPRLIKMTPNLGTENMTEINGKWFPSRGIGGGSVRERLTLAWGVFTGKWDALEWPGGQ